MTKGNELTLGRIYLGQNKPTKALRMFQREFMKYEGGEMILRLNDLKSLNRF